MNEQEIPKHTKSRAVLMILALLIIIALLCGTAGAAPASAQPEHGPRKVSNVWVDVPLSQVVRDISMQARATIALDPTVQDSLISLEADPPMKLEDCLERIAAGQGLAVKKVKEAFYVIGSGDPDSPTFSEVSENRRVYLHYISADHVSGSLPKALQKYVSSGKRENEVLICAPDKKMNKVMDAIKKLDTPRRQVVLEALVVELSEEAGNKFGIDWKRVGPDSSFSSVHDISRFVGGAQYASVDQRALRELTLTLRMLVREDLAKVRSRPRVATLNGEQATIDISLEQYFTIVTDVNGDFLQTELQVVDSGVKLDMTPHIGKDDDITVDVETEVSDVVRQRSEVSNSQGVQGTDLPVIRRRKADTKLRVKDGDAIVIGGLVETLEREREDRVPVLGSIPLVGRLFRDTEKVTEKREVMIFITPRLLEPGQTPFEGRHSAIEVGKELQQMGSGKSKADGVKDQE